VTHGQQFAFVVPTDTRLTRDLALTPDQLSGAQEGDLVVAEILRYPTDRRGAEGRVVRVIGRSGDAAIDTDTVIAEFELPTAFPPDVEREAAALPDRTGQAMLGGREDLRGLATVTIDGEHAKDFDDAVSIDPQPGGAARLWVHIADVSAYVPWDGALDLEARRRATSVYFPDRVIPMFPERLSNGICSLNPGEDRLTLTCEMDFDARGRRTRYRLYPSVILSRERLTYTAVGRILEHSDPELSRRYAPLMDDLQAMGRLCHLLRGRRRERGSIDFDLPEPEILLDMLGETTAILRQERTIAHRLIEEFMLAANETVAEHLSRFELPMLYRVHERPDPDKLANFAEVLAGFGHALAVTATLPPKTLARLVETVKGRTEEALINYLLLRSMKQARYATENAGHFGLASAYYTHFTSPIRRYPDLVIHRLVKVSLGQAGPPPDRFARLMPDIARTSSAQERVSMEAEREVIDLKKTRYMADKVGQEYQGVISGVTAYGFFVQLSDIFVEGLVHVTALGDDYYHYVERQHALTGERRRRTFRLGDQVRVVVDRVDLLKRRVDFTLAEDEPSARLEPATRPRRGRAPAGHSKNQPKRRAKSVPAS
jgi:ribonuclease R